MKTRILLIVLTALGGTTTTSNSYATEGEPIRYSGAISGFALSDSADGAESAIRWNEVDVGRFLHIHVLASVPSDVTVLQGKCRKLPKTGLGDPGSDFDLPAAKRISGQYFDFVITHYTLEKDAAYLVRVAEGFSSKDAKFVAAHSFRTKK